MNRLLRISAACSLLSKQPKKAILQHCFSVRSPSQLSPLSSSTVSSLAAQWRKDASIFTSKMISSNSMSAIKAVGSLQTTTSRSRFCSSSRIFDARTHMSSHFVLKDEELVGVLKKFNMEYKMTDVAVQVEWCPFCKKPHNYQQSNAYTLGLKRSSGAFNCFRCGIKGSWWDFKNLLFGNTSLHDFENSTIATQTFESTLNDGEYYLYHRQLLEDRDNYKDELELITGKSKRSQRHIDFAILEKYKVGIGKESFSTPTGKQILVPVLYFPMFERVEPEESDNTPCTEDERAQQYFNRNEDKLIDFEKKNKSVTISTETAKLVKYKIRGIGKNNKQYMRMSPTGVKSGIFGLNTVPSDATEVVITEGEYDAMAVHQATGMFAISLPTGATNLPLETLSSLERFTKIYLWLDNDEIGRGSCRKLAEKLGLNRTYIVRTDSEKDANDILRKNPLMIKPYIEESCTIPDQNILTFENLSEKVLNRLRRVQLDKGVSSRRFDFFNNTISGLRKGELTIFTGPTGSGKTSFLSQLSVDFCEQGVSTLWGSFEIKNEILATNMLMQMSGQDFSRSQENFQYWGDHFEQLPMYFMNFFGSTSLQSVIHTIEYAIYKYGIQHVVIDNLQFLLGTQAKGFDKFDLQDQSIEAFRQLATAKEIHVTLVIHPRKVEEKEDLHISSVFGSAKATQEADNVIILQRRDHYRVFDVKKNRYNGEIGSKGIIFDRTNKNFYELDYTEVRDIISKKTFPSVIVETKRAIVKKKITDEHLNIVRRPRKPKLNTGPSNPPNDDQSGTPGNSNPPPSSSPSPAHQPSSSPPSSSSPARSADSLASKKDLVQEMLTEKVQHSLLFTDYQKNGENKSLFDGSPLYDIPPTPSRLHQTEYIKEIKTIDEKIEEEVVNQSKSSKEEIEQWEKDDMNPTGFDAILSERRFIPPTNQDNRNLGDLERELHPDFHQKHYFQKSQDNDRFNSEEIGDFILDQKMQNQQASNSNRKRNDSEQEDGQLTEEILRRKQLDSKIKLKKKI